MDLGGPEVTRLRAAARLAALRAGAEAAWADDIADEALARLLVTERAPDNAVAWVRRVALATRDGWRLVTAERWHPPGCSQAHKRRYANRKRRGRE